MLIQYILVLLIKPRIFDISVDFYFLNVFSSLLSNLLQIIERTIVLLKTYGILEFLSFLYLLNKAIDFFHPHLFRIYSKNKFLASNNFWILVLLYHPFHIRWEKINLYNLTNFYHLT